MKRKLTIKERMACLTLSHLKYDKDDHLTDCAENDRILRLAEILLDGRDPVEFAIWVIDDKEYVEPVDISTYNY